MRHTLTKLQARAWCHLRRRGRRQGADAHVLGVVLELGVNELDGEHGQGDRDHRDDENCWPPPADM